MARFSMGQVLSRQAKTRSSSQGLRSHTHTTVGSSVTAEWVAAAKDMRGNRSISAASSSPSPSPPRSAPAASAAGVGIPSWSGRPSGSASAPRAPTSRSQTWP